MAQNLAYDSKNYLISEDTSTIQSLISGIKMEPDIMKAVIIDKEGKIRAHSIQEHIGDSIIIPDSLISYGEKLWIPTENTILLRMAVPIERVLPEIDIHSSLYMPFNPFADDTLLLNI